MLHLPSRIETHLIDLGGQPLRESDVLVAINVLVDGRYYFGNLIGLTNDDGVAAIEGLELELRFLHDRATFPMDYKVELTDCDEQIELVLLGAADIREARAALKGSGGIATDIRPQYTSARNHLFAPSLVRVFADMPSGGVLKLFLGTRRLENQSGRPEGESEEHD